MRNTLLITSCLVASMILAGCETFTRPTQRIQLQRGSVMLVDTVATRRGTYLVKRGSGADARWLLVAEPPPDAAMASAVKAAAEVAGKAAASSSGEASIDVTQTLLKLVERTQAITILRDSLFRLSEAYANETINGDAYQRKYSEVLKVVRTIALADLQAKKNQAKALEIQQTFLEMQMGILLDPRLEEQQKIKKLQTLRLPPPPAD